MNNVFGLFEQIEKVGLKLDDGTIISIFASYAECGLLGSGKRVHASIERVDVIVKSKNVVFNDFDSVLKTDPSERFSFETERIMVRHSISSEFVNKARKLPKHNNLSWTGSLYLGDWKDKPETFYKDLVGGYCDVGETIKFNFPVSFAMTMLSWSVYEYDVKYKVAGELSHAKEVIRWGADYFLKTFNNSAIFYNSNGYYKELMSEKAEAFIEKMKELNLVLSSMSYNSMMTLYIKVDQLLIPAIIQEMKADNISYLNVIQVLVILKDTWCIKVLQRMGI